MTPDSAPAVLRDYAAIARRLQTAALGDRRERMQRLVDLVWDSMHGAGVSWVGFYLHEGGDELVLGPRRDKPACSPIGLHGVCGQAFRSRSTRIVRDVAELGGDYIACDPRDRSELVVPCLGADGACWGVLDLDSHEVGAFCPDDDAGLRLLLRTAGLTAE